MVKCIKYFGALLCVFVLGEINSAAQQPDLSQWDPAVVEEANTAKNVDYMTGEEKMVILITNLARKDGPLFSRTILESYIREKERSKYIRSLQKDLARMKDLRYLHPERDLYEIASGHATASGKTGAVGHAGFEKRFKPLLKKYNMVAENCAYGFEKGMDNALMLLIDEGVKNLGHRKNSLSRDYNSIGVSIQKHKKYRYNCVMDFGKK